MTPITLTIDSSTAVDEQAAERIAASWKSEFPEPETEAETEETKKNAGE
jgi:hypothetical protein